MRTLERVPKWQTVLLTIFLSTLFVQTKITAGEITIKEETITIPTYDNGAPNLMPRYKEEGNKHQGIQRRVYPYPMDDNTTNIKKDKTYHMIHVENEYLDLGIIPELGGRLYYAVDKTNDYNIFYRNEVIKPSLIGMVGNWISGSLAWGFPDHHGPNTVKPMDYTVENNEDGSKTIWVTNTDKMYRMNALVGYTIYPNSSLIEMSIKFENSTPYAHPYLFWAVPAVWCDENYEVIYPPSVKYVAYHYKRDITSWPIADSFFNNYDFTGLHIGKWKNTFVPSSFFAWKPQDDFFGGYDHKQQAGTAWVGNHHVCQGMKYWTDGNNAYGLSINNGLTDNSGRYIELMSGLYTDNQPDYSWLQPYEEKSGKMTWFPIRELGGLKYANLNGALNFDIAHNTINVKMNATVPHQDATFVLKSKGKELVNKTINISPAEPFKMEVSLPADTKENDLEILLNSQEGEELICYVAKEFDYPEQPRPKEQKAIAPEDPFKELPLPEEIKTVEELYLTGLRLDQFKNPYIKSDPFFKEALNRDPSDYRVNTHLGLVALWNYDWIKAEKYLRTAVDRATMYYTRPKDGEALYYLGVALRSKGSIQEAYDKLYDAAWTTAWNTPAYYQIAEIDCQRGDYQKALEHVDRSISTNTEELKGLNLRAVILRNLNNIQEAQKQAQIILKKHNLNHQALNELYLTHKLLGNHALADIALENMTKLMRDDVQSYLELAASYINCGAFNEAIDLLTRLEAKGNKFPMVYYYKGFLFHKMNNNDKALEYCKLASTMPFDYCFPHRSEEIEILNFAQQINPGDSFAPYYLGNLYYEQRPDMAISEWEKSRALNPSFYIVHRNLAQAYREYLRDYPQALASIQKAYELKKDDSRLLYEYDELNGLNFVSPKEKYNLLKSNLKTVRERSETTLRFVIRAVEYGKYDEALDIVLNYRFVVFERDRERQQAILNAYTLRGLRFADKKQYKKAINDLEVAKNYPRWYEDLAQNAQFCYLLGSVYKKMGNTQKAETYFKEALETNVTYASPDYEYMYYKARSMEELGMKDEATILYNDMLNAAMKARDNNKFPLYSRTEMARYMIRNHMTAGLAYRGLGQIEKARTEFTDLLKHDPNSLWSGIYLAEMK